MLDADIKGCFEHISHSALLEQLRTCPTMKQVIKGWLKAGALDEWVFAPTEMGTPQGGVVSPLLANIALHGLEEAVKQAYTRKEELNPVIRGWSNYYRTQASRATFQRCDNILYWYKRLKHHPLMDSEKAKLLSIQKGMCPKCGLYFREGDLLEVDHSIPTALGGKDDITNTWVYHRHCHDEKTAEDLVHRAKRKVPGIRDNDHMTEEPNEGKPSRSVLKTSRFREKPA